MTDFTLSDLDRLIAERMKADDPSSYTTRLKAGGQDMAAKKLGEEAVEMVIAAVTKDKAALCSEAADLLYHLLVVLNLGGVSMDRVMEELQGRTRQSGLEEKASRSKA